MKLENLYPDDYFDGRLSNDPLRLASFHDEGKMLKRHISHGRLLDIGCSTGEFISSLDWQGECYGMEVSQLAITAAKSEGVRFDRNIFDTENFFDCIIFRGTIQHIDTPFLYLQKCYLALQPNGYLAFFATPNANSLYYKLWNSLPALDDPRNFYIPSDITLKNALKNIGFEIIECRYPYWNGPYASPAMDHIKFAGRLTGLYRGKFPFWRNMMDLIFRKPDMAQ